MRVIATPWGELRPQVDMLPVVYLIVLYGLVWFLPFGVFEFWRKGEDGPVEWLQFLGYAGACLGAWVVVWHRRRLGFSMALLGWVALALFCFLMAGEEISWGERITGFGLETVREINAQEETNLHNIPLLQGYMHFAFIFFNLLFGYIGWRCFPRIDALPARRFSLYFLPVALFYAWFDLSWITRGDRIRNDQEAIELLMALGLFLHAWAVARRSRTLSPGP
ncbi:pectate lyase [Cyanobium sp. FGCU-52]|nr:pectate lyase [Cyanobium sp. FGCU52]